MRYGWMRASFAVCMLAAAAVVVNADVRAELQKEYDRYIKAYKSHDLKTLDAMATPDFKMKMGNTVMDRTQAMAMMKQEFASMPKGGEATVKVGKITTKGNTVIAVSTGSFKNKMKGPDGKWHQMAGSGKSRETFVKTPSGWKIKLVEQLSMSMTMDGKPVDPMTMQPIKK